MLEPADIGFERVTPESLFGGKDVPEAAAIFTQVLSGEGSASQNAAVLANSTLAIQTISPTKSIADCKEEARASLFGGKGFQAFNHLITTSQQ